VLEALCRIFPHADVFTLVGNRDYISDRLKGHNVTTSWLDRLPWAERHYALYAPLFPLAVEEFDLSDYQLVISSDAAVCKGVLTQPETCHVCYCHSPLRYAWNAYYVYRKSIENRLGRAVFSLSMHYLRQWDYAAATRVDHFVANSQNVASRIRKYYRRSATVIYPPIEISRFSINSITQDYYLAAGQLVPYKRFDLAIEAFNRLQLPLWIAGDGPEYRRLKRMAQRNINFLGRASDEDWARLLSQCRALVFPGEEDFGMVMVEANACGRPVIAFARGGALEVVVPELNGLLFNESTVSSLIAAIRRFESLEGGFMPLHIRETSLGFGYERFQDEITSYLEEKLREPTAIPDSHRYVDRRLTL
jgi:glycosyltransferase involved in cell wall biosynthesis